MTLSEFLLAQITEDEAVAQGALVADIATVAHEHMARWNPDRVVAECEAKRRIVEWCVAAEDRMQPPAPLIAMNVLAALALPYADQPDYLPEWRA